MPPPPPKKGENHSFLDNLIIPSNIFLFTVLFTTVRQKRKDFKAQKKADSFESAQ